ncbi:MAG: hypothetical protein H6724_10180 [Sandaracinus sp.]|nr:hypothetical protein [Sandaracinus sp.]
MHEHGIETGAVTPEQNARLKGLAIPAENGGLVLGNARAWDAIVLLGGPLAEQGRRLQGGEGMQLHALRNKSILAHGYNPLGPKDFEQLDEVISAAMTAFTKHLRKLVPVLPQLPKRELLD